MCGHHEFTGQQRDDIPHGFTRPNHAEAWADKYAAPLSRGPHTAWGWPSALSVLVRRRGFPLRGRPWKPTISPQPHSWGRLPRRDVARTASPRHQPACRVPLFLCRSCFPGRPTSGAGTSQVHVRYISRAAARIRSPSSRRTAANPTARPGPPPARAPARLPRHRQQTSAAALPAHCGRRPPPGPRRATARPWPSVKADGAHRPRQGHWRPSAICPWTPLHNAVQRYKMTHGKTAGKRPAQPHIRS
jgi:hypothetical protein